MEQSDLLNKIYVGIWFKNSINLIKLCYKEIKVFNDQLILEFNKENMHLFVETYITDDLTKVYNQRIIFRFYNDSEKYYIDNVFSIYNLLININICNFKIDPLDKLEIITKYHLNMITCLHLNKLNEIVIAFKDSGPTIKKEDMRYMFDFYNKLSFIPNDMEVRLVNFNIPYDYYNCLCKKKELLKINDSEFINLIDKIDWDNINNINEIIMPKLIKKIEKIINKQLFKDNICEYEIIDLYNDGNSQISLGISVEDITILINNYNSTMYMVNVEIDNDKTIKFLLY